MNVWLLSVVLIIRDLCMHEVLLLSFFFCFVLVFPSTERMMLVSVVHNRPDQTTRVCISKAPVYGEQFCGPPVKHTYPQEKKKKNRERLLNSFLTVQSVTLSCQMCSTFTVFYSSCDTRQTDCLWTQWCLWSESPYFTQFLLYTKGGKNDKNMR